MKEGDEKCKILITKCKGKKVLKRPRHRRNVNIKMDPKDVGCSDNMEANTRQKSC